MKQLRVIVGREIVSELFYVWIFLSSFSCSIRDREWTSTEEDALIAACKNFNLSLGGRFLIERLGIELRSSQPPRTSKMLFGNSDVLDSII